MRHQRLHKQHLLASSTKDPVAVLKSLVAVQAQDYYGAKWALGQRTIDCNDDAVEQAFADGRILRLHLLRPTWHFVTPADVRWLLKLTAPQVNHVSSYYYRKSELDHRVFKKTNRVLAKTLQGGKQFTRSELRLAIKRAGVEPGDSVRLGHIMFRAELDAVVCSGARKGNQFTYALLDERAPHGRTLQPDEALGELTERYFKTRGPATIQDYAWWSGLTVSQAKRGVEIVGPQLKKEVIDLGMYWTSATKTKKTKDTKRVAHLLPPYDEYFISYKDRRAAIHPDFNQKSLVERLVFDSPLTLDGQVVGGWKRVFGKDFVTIQLKPFTKLTRADREVVMVAARKYARFLGKGDRVEWLV
jgi:hypothetical protein